MARGEAHTVLLAPRVRGRGWRRADQEPDGLAHHVTRHQLQEDKATNAEGLSETELRGGGVCTAPLSISVNEVTETL